jgi:phosphomannomutase
VAALKEHFASEKVDTQDGIRIDWAYGWIHARASNTEPIMRIIAEATNQNTALNRIADVRTIVDRTI